MENMFENCKSINTFLGGLKQNTNYTYTENGALTHKQTGSKVFDMFALGGAYRSRSENDCINLFKNAYKEDTTLALKCLFYMRDAREGQGERRFFRVCFKWLCDKYPEAAKRNLEQLAEYGRWDDLLYATDDTQIQDYALFLIKEQLALDLDCQTPSLLAKWLPSENASAHNTKKMANKVRKYLKMTHKQYRKVLATLRQRINIVERLMSENRWDEIEFDKIPSRAGMIYKNAFARRDMIKEKYRAFAKDETKKVNASVLYPHEVAKKAFNNHDRSYDATDRLMIQKYWDNLKDYYNGRQENGIAVVDVSGSMYPDAVNVSVGLGAYIAERGKGPFQNHFITFSESPELVEFTGVDIVDKFQRAAQADWGYNTDLEAVFDLLLKTATDKGVKPQDMPERLYIISDMEFDAGLNVGRHYGRFTPEEEMERIKRENEARVNTLCEEIAEKWKRYGYELPTLIFWNVDARQDNIPMLTGRFAYISGFSATMLEQILSGVDGYQLMLKKLLSERYEAIK